LLNEIKERFGKKQELSLSIKQIDNAKCKKIIDQKFFLPKIGVTKNWFNPCGENDQLVVNLYFAKNG